MYKYIGFDLFGTLFSLDETTHKRKILQESLETNEYDIFKKHWVNWHKNSYDVETFLNKINQDLNFSLDEKKLNLIKWRIILEEPSLYSDVLPTLKSLIKDGYSLALLTNSPPTAKKLFKNKKELSGLFKATFWSFEIGFMKPEAKAFEYMIQSLNVSNNELLYVGDGYERDYQGAKNYGLHVLLLDRLGQYPDVVERIDTLSDITKHF